MYHFLKGKIIEKITDPVGSEKLVLEVNGVGYEIQSSLSTLNLFGKVGDTCTVFTALIHKEDQMTLVGFPTLMEKELFNLLCSVSGIGPKSALNLLGSLTVSEISYSILHDDPSVLSKANGIGERTASRIILELKEKVKNWKHLPIAYSGKNGSKEAMKQGSNEEQGFITNDLNEARSVLQALGYSSGEINQAFTHAKTNGNHDDSEALIHFSLKWLSTSRSL